MRIMQLFALAIVALCSGGAAAATAYASNEGSGTVSVIDTATDRVTATITTGGKPRGIALSLDGTKLYLSDQEANALVVVDTAHFKGNYPDRCFIQGVADASGTPEEIAAQAESWPVLLPEVKLSADSIHSFRDELADIGPVRFVRLNILPDGGVSRLRLIGRVAR